MLTHRHISNLIQVSRPNTPEASPARSNKPLTPASDERREVWLHQFVQVFGNEAWIPLSVGCIAAHAKADSEFNDHFAIQPLVYMRAAPKEIVNQYTNPAVLGFSAYIWNVKLSLAVARLAKERFPNTLVVFGGPSAPTDNHSADSFLREHPYVDVLVSNEGEKAFLEVCLANLHGSGLQSVKGLHFLSNGVCIETTPRLFTKDMDELASPYLTGTFDELMSGPIKFHAIWETDRGCPFLCGFCYWGDKSRSVKARVGLDRLEQEMDWFIRNKIELLYIADSNFGWLERNKVTARGLAQRALAHGYPKKVMLTWAKNANDKVFETAQILNTAGLCYPITMSYQSLDEVALRNILRSNIALNRTKELRKKYIANNMSSYTDLLIGIPGETFTSFVDGIEDVISYGEHDQIQIYAIRILPNTDMARPEYIAQHQIKTVWVPLLTKHGAMAENDPVQEMEEIIVETATMPREDWKRIMEITWFTQCFFCLKSAYFVCLFLNLHLGFRIMDFALFFLERIRKYPTLELLNREIKRVAKFLETFLEGNPAVDSSDIDLPPVKWPIEEVTFIALAMAREQFHRELRTIVDEFIAARGKQCDPELLDQVFAYQRARVVNPAGPSETELCFDWSLPEFFEAAILLEPIPLVREKVMMQVHENVKYSNLHDFARFQVWYGRQGKPFYYKTEYQSMSQRDRTATSADDLALPAKLSPNIAVPTIST
jgi:putative methyltransferase